MNHSLWFTRKPLTAYITIHGTRNMLVYRCSARITRSVWTQPLLLITMTPQYGCQSVRVDPGNGRLVCGTVNPCLYSQS